MFRMPVARVELAREYSADPFSRLQPLVSCSLAGAPFTFHDSISRNFPYTARTYTRRAKRRLPDSDLELSARLSLLIRAPLWEEGIKSLAKQSRGLLRRDWSFVLGQAFHGVGKWEEETRCFD